LGAAQQAVLPPATKPQLICSDPAPVSLIWSLTQVHHGPPPPPITQDRLRVARTRSRLHRSHADHTDTAGAQYAWWNGCRVRLDRIHRGGNRTVHVTAHGLVRPRTGPP